MCANDSSHERFLHVSGAPPPAMQSGGLPMQQGTMHTSALARSGGSAARNWFFRSSIIAVARPSNDCEDLCQPAGSARAGPAVNFIDASRKRVAANRAAEPPPSRPGREIQPGMPRGCKPLDILGARPQPREPDALAGPPCRAPVDERALAPASIRRAGSGRAAGDRARACDRPAQCPSPASLTDSRLRPAMQARKPLSWT